MRQIGADQHSPRGIVNPHTNGHSTSRMWPHRNGAIEDSKG